MREMLLAAMVVAGCNGGALSTRQPQCSVSFASPQSLVNSTKTPLLNGIEIDSPSAGTCAVQDDGEMTMATIGFSFTVGPDYIEIHDKKSGVDCSSAARPSRTGNDWTFDAQCGNWRVIGASFWSLSG